MRHGAKILCSDTHSQRQAPSSVIISAFLSIQTQFATLLFKYIQQLLTAFHRPFKVLFIMNSGPGANPAIVPVLTPAVTGIDDLIAHINDLQAQTNHYKQELQEDPDAELHLEYNQSLFDTVADQVTDFNRPALAQAILPQLVGVLRLSQSDLSPTLSLLPKLLKDLHFNEILDLATEDELCRLLARDIPGPNLLALEIVHKACKSAQCCEFLSGCTMLLNEVVHTWLMSSDTRVGDLATRVIGDILEMDCAAKSTMVGDPYMRLTASDVDPGELDQDGSGKVWHAIWVEGNEYEGIRKNIMSQIWFFADEVDGAGRTYRDASLSQGRVLEILPRLVALEPMLMLNSSVFDHAATIMVKKSDELMFRNFEIFLVRLFCVMRVTARRNEEVDRKMARVLNMVCEDSRVRGMMEQVPNTLIEEEAEPMREYLHLLWSYNEEHVVEINGV